MGGDAPERNSSSPIRHRSPTFTHSETKALLNIIDKFKTIILNKQSNAAATKAKELTWLKIAKVYNNQTSVHSRSATCLKFKWLNLKRDVKKLTSNVMDEGAKLDELTQQAAAIISEVENNKSVGNDFSEPDLDFPIEENEMNDSQCNGNNEKECDETFDEDVWRYRSPVFSQEETLALLKIMYKYKTIILNKCSNAVASRAKDTAWSKVAKSFNAQGFETRRSPFNLKTKWLNLKSYVKKLMNDKNAPFKTEFDDEITRIVVAMSKCENNTVVIDEQMESETEFNFNEENNEEKSSDGSADGDKEIAELMDDIIKFSPEECSLLLRCAKPEKHIIFSKVISAESKKLKAMAWDRIKDSFNKVSHQKRSTKVLRKKFNNLKSRITQGNFRDLLKDLNIKPHKQEDAFKKIKTEPLFETKREIDHDIADDIDDSIGIEIDQDSDHYVDSNHALDPLSTVLSTDSGLSSMNPSENKEVVKLKLELLNYELETAKLKRKRIQDLAKSEAAERETKAVENALRLRAARLEVTAAEMRLPPGHTSLAYTPEEEKAQYYMHQYRDN